MPNYVGAICQSLNHSPYCCPYFISLLIVNVKYYYFWLSIEERTSLASHAFLSQHRCCSGLLDAQSICLQISASKHSTAVDSLMQSDPIANATKCIVNMLGCSLIITVYNSPIRCYLHQSLPWTHNQNRAFTGRVIVCGKRTYHPLLL